MPSTLFYNTQHPKILFKEYGRGVQQMVAYALNIEDRQERSRIAKGIIQVMSELLPAQNKKTDEFQHKLWDHLHIIANFELDVDCPFPKPTPDVLHHQIQPLAYPRLHIKHKHYGRHIEILVQRAIDMPSGAPKTALVRVIAHYMKMIHKNLKNEIVSEESIRNDLKSLSKGKLDIIFTDENTLVLEPDLPESTRKRKHGHNKPKQKEAVAQNGNGNNQQQQNNAPPVIVKPSPQPHTEPPSTGGGKRKRHRKKKKSQ